MAKPQHLLVLDLGEVIFRHHTDSLTSFSSKVFAQIIRSPPWNSHERGEIEEGEALELLSPPLGVSFVSLRAGLEECRATLYVDFELLEQLKALKDKMGSSLKIVAMSNVCEEDYRIMLEVLEDWTLFEHVFTSYETGARKPELDFYSHVLQKTGADPQKTVFVDDNIDNVIAARLLGINGILYEPKCGREQLIQQLHNLFFDPLKRAEIYMKENAGSHISNIEGGPSFTDAFSQFLIHEMMQDASLLNLNDPSAQNEDPIAALSTNPRHRNYFLGSPVGTTAEFPDDVDTTSYSLLAFTPANRLGVYKVLSDMLKNRDKSGLVQTYWDPERPRVDPIVLVNVTRAFYKYGCGGLVPECLDYVRKTLENRGYVYGTLHYYSPESFLFFVSRLVQDHKQAQDEIRAIRGVLVERLRERVGRKDDSLATALRVLACQAMAVWCAPDVEYLMSLQQVDGGWENGWVCRYGRSRKRIGNRGVVTAYAIRVLRNLAAANPKPS